MRCDAATKTKTVSGVQIRFSSSTSKWDGMDKYSTCIEVAVTCIDKKGNERVIGKVRLFYLDLDAVFDTKIVDRLEILPEFRGKKIGLASLVWCLRQYARECGVVALKCFPLQFECSEMGEPAWRREMQFGKLSRDRKRSLAKLKKYYGSLGFKVLPVGDIMVA